MKRLKDTDIVICPVCNGKGITHSDSDDVATCSYSCPHGSYITYETFKFIRLPKEIAEKY